MKALAVSCLLHKSCGKQFLAEKRETPRYTLSNEGKDEVWSV